MKKALQSGFGEWLQTLGYAASTVRSLPAYVAELLTWLENKNIEKPEKITSEHIRNFFFQWKRRRNKRTGAGLSINHINKGVLALNKFTAYLKAVHGCRLELHLEREQVPPACPHVLSREQIGKLYEATYLSDRRINREAFAQRDRAMLGVFYGCGLRKTEGTSLLAGDVLLRQKLLYVRNGKGGKSRYVPLSEQTLADLEIYLNYSRHWFLQQRQKRKNRHTEFFFVNIFGGPMQGFDQRLRELVRISGIEGPVHLHTLRHSIATHLLSSGMDIEQIRRFLGHSTLESTQIYTHISGAL
jgi:site-specific recombinase XerD